VSQLLAYDSPGSTTFSEGGGMVAITKGGRGFPNPGEAV